jgi:small-conductance mechanosensitive channel
LTKKQSRSARVYFVGRYVFWIAIRVVALIVLFLLLEVGYRFGYLAFVGSADIQLLVYNVLQKAFFSLIVWFFIAVSKKIILPVILITISPVVSKVVKDPASRLKTSKTTIQYLNYFIYIIAIIALILIWAYSFIGEWIAATLGTGLVISLTFILGLFTSSVLGNILGYTILSGTNEFKIGDRVQIGESYGDIIEIGMFFTRIKTIKDEIISIPNLTVMGKEIKNYSTLKQVLIYVPVTLGYDVDKDTAKRLLIESAERTNGIIGSKDNLIDYIQDAEGVADWRSTINRKPFVLLRDLGNYTITYEINAYTDKPNQIVNIKSELIDNILTDFKKANIEILSPSHLSIRNYNLSPLDKHSG